ncbi:glycerophosphodiester phosphodiesterase family protein [Methylovirgula sp. 4M-Z18]|uniref:glycerophosphodiester phosphodiesterase family protein n=1 Tax=Methylovirgula sp. 4M-Z18 TaxID=2293567 RepID=UPI000E2F5ED2|nr:glycerophosphodiester phosphodiesterase family protein [Methylovirgula sp. 4M-Z18]RFB80599.1 glycerophosphodiester phosphodiesterase [Methylovirgula sp. 4M-Z18]
MRRPIAHRGLHDKSRAILENTKSAAEAAIVLDFGIECDVQLTADGEAVVFHDFTLDRLTEGRGSVDRYSVQELAAIPLKMGKDRIPTLPQLLELLAGRVPLTCEIKSRFDNDMRLVERVAAILADYDGPVAIKSFDSDVIAHLRRNPQLLQARPRPLGIVSQARWDDEEWDEMSAERKHVMENFLHWNETKPDFLSFWVQDIDTAVPYLLRNAVGLPVMSWTVRTPEQREKVARYADQMVFEGFVP